MIKNRSNLGITLIELIVTMSMAAILIAFGVPSVNKLIKDNRITSNVANVLSSLSLTRSEAIKRGARVTICIANATFDQCSTTRKWKDGWIVFVDPVIGDGLGIHIDSDSDIIQVFQGLDGSQTTLETPGLALEQTHISFLGDGIGYDQTGGIGNRTFVLCDDRALTENKKYARKIIVDPRGRARSILASEDGGAAVLTCVQI